MSPGDVIELILAIIGGLTLVCLVAWGFQDFMKRGK